MAFVKLCIVVFNTICSTWLIAGAEDFYSAATLKKIAEFDDFINDTINPCDDFEQYVCSHAKVSYFETIYAETNALIKNRILSGKRETDINAVKKLIDFYQQCTVAFAKRNESVQNMVDDLDSIFKNGTDTFQKFDATMIAKLSAYLTVYHHYDFAIGNNYLKYNKSARFPKRETFLVIFEPALSQEREKYDPKNISAFTYSIKKGLSEAYAILEPNKTEVEVTAIVSKLFDFEVEVSKLFKFNLTYPDVYYDAPEVTVVEAMEQFPGVDWKTFVTLISKYSDFVFLNGTELDDYPLKIEFPDLWKALPFVLENTPDEVIRDYIRVRLVNQVSSLSLKTDLESDCLSMVKEAFPIVYQYLYITERLSTDADREKLKSSVSKLADNIIAQVKVMMEKISWMRNDTETYAGFTDKMNKLTKSIAYPDYFVNETWLNDHYKTISISENDTLYNLLMITNTVQIRILLEEVDTDEKITSPDAYMAQLENRFVISLGILHDIFYNPDYIPVFNYGGIGAIIGHEVIHGYDTTGVNFDGDGDFRPWMSNKSRQSFDKMADCVIDEYSNFTLTDSNGTVWHINGTITSGENVADNAGIRAAYNAFKSDPVNVQPFPRTKKLKDFTQDQLFFVSFARNSCSPPIADKDIAEYFADVHPPSQFRVFGTLRNFVPFREAFNCPVGSKYAPEKFCQVYAPS